MPWYANLKDAYGPLVPPDVDEGYSDKMTPIPMNRPVPSGEAPKVEDTVEFKKATEHVKTSVFSPNLPHLPVREMDSCQDYRVHLRNCPACQDYMRQLLNKSPTLKESFLNIEKGSEDPASFFEKGSEDTASFFKKGSEDPLIDIIAIVGIGILLIFVLDSFMRLSLKR